MTDHFLSLSLPRKAALPEEEIREAFHEIGRRHHPDSGESPDAEIFGAGNVAQQVLSDPGKRIGHLLELVFEGREREHEGSIDGVLMGIFSEVGTVLPLADALVRKKAAVQSTLAKALLEKETVAVQKKLTGATTSVTSLTEGCLARLEELDTLLARAPEEGWALGQTLYRELSFLTRWKMQLQESFAKLF